MKGPEITGKIAVEAVRKGREKREWNWLDTTSAICSAKLPKKARITLFLCFFNS